MRRYTPENIVYLQPNEIFVFGSNLLGQHGSGAARYAMDHFGAQWGVGNGPTGQCYAIPTMHEGIKQIAPYVNQFIDYAISHRSNIFYVTKIGCGKAGFSINEIAQLFMRAINVENIILPEEFIYAIHRFHPKTKDFKMKIVNIGRGNTNQIDINDDMVSRCHCEIIQDDRGGFRIKDTNSKNGTYVNGFPIPVNIECPLNRYDIVKIGNTPLNWHKYFGDLTMSIDRSNNQICNPNNAPAPLVSIPENINIRKEVKEEYVHAEVAKRGDDFQVPFFRRIGESLGSTVGCLLSAILIIIVIVIVASILF